MSNLEIVRRFLKSNENTYIEFLNLVKGASSELARELGGQVIIRVYDRRDKQGGEAMKDAVKVYEACKRPVTQRNIKKITDIIGVTIVVQYPDQIPLVLDKLATKLKADLVLEATRKAHSATYYGTHATYRYEAVTHGGIFCEVQCKTVLHDAWSAKMHDLTYKPSGSMDARMKGLIEAISQSLEGIEQQSQIARDIISGRQRGERKPFATSLAAFLSGVEGLSIEGQTDSVSSLREEVRTFASFETMPTSAQAVELGTKIREALEEPEIAGSAWLIAVRFAGALGGNDAIRFLSNAVEILLDGLLALRAAEQITEAEIRAIPIGFYALQDFARAIEIVDLLINQSEPLNLSEECLHILKFNKATWMLEKESLRPSNPKFTVQIRSQIDSLLAAARPALSMMDEAVVNDTDGLYKIVYGATKEEVRDGIDLCLKAGAQVETDELESAVALAYAEWRSHAGWRKYFELAENELDGETT